MSLLRPSRGPCGPRRALRLLSSVVAVHRRATTPSRERKPRSSSSSSSSSSTAATAATPTSTQSTSTEPPPQAAPPSDFDLRSSLVPQTRAIISERWPELLDLVDDGTLVAVARPEDYRERRSDGYSEPQLVLLVAAAHISRASASAATRVVEAVKPDAVVLELCGSRKSVLAEEEGEEEVSSSSSSSSPSFRSADKGRKASNPFALSGSIARSASLGGAPAMALRLLLARQSDAVLEAAMENESEGDETSTPSSSLSSAFSRRPGVEARAAAAGALLVVRLLVLVLSFFERKRRASLPPPQKKKVAASSDAGSAQRSFF